MGRVAVLLVALVLGLGGGLLVLRQLEKRPASLTQTPATQPEVSALPTSPAAPLETPEVQSVPAPVPPLPEFDLETVPGSAPAAGVARPAPAVPEPQFSLAPAPTAKPDPVLRVPPSSTPLDSLNAVRKLAGLPPVQRHTTWDADCAAHALYMLATDTGGHSEDPADPHYTAAGAACAPGHYFVTARPDATVSRAVTYWMNGPFHLPQMIDPRLKQVGFAVLHDLQGEVQTAAALDLRRGRSGAGRYPVKFPAPGMSVTAAALSQNEYPDALPGCPGYAHPVGAPMALLLGAGQTPMAGQVSVNGQAIESCFLNAQNFSGASEADTRTGRSVLAAQGVGVLLPRHPLPGGARVAVSFQTTGGKVNWAFRTR